MRTPLAGHPATQRERLIAKLRRDLERFRRIPAERREAECADEGESTCLALLRLTELAVDEVCGSPPGNYPGIGAQRRHASCIHLGLVLGWHFTRFKGRPQFSFFVTDEG